MHRSSLAVLLLLAVTACRVSASITSAQCTAAGGSISGNYCYKYESTARTFNAAEAQCGVIFDGGHLVSYTSNGEETFSMSLAPSNSQFFWIGLTDQNNEGTWNVWTDGTVFSYDRWIGGEPNNQGGTEDCAHSQDIGWNDGTCSGQTLPSVCKARIIAEQILTPAECTAAGGVVYADGSSCFKFISTGANYGAARDACYADGFNFGTINTQGEQDFVAANIPSTLAGYWFGLNDILTEGTYTNVDNTAPDGGFTLPWEAPNPNDFNNVEECINFKPSSDQWADSPCSSSFGSVCEIPVSVYTEHPLLCEYNSTAERRYYQVDESTACPGTADTTNTCYFDVNALSTSFPTVLRVDGADPDFGAPESRLANDGSDDRIYLAFDVPSKYYNVEIVFPDENTPGSCGTWQLETQSYTSTDKADCYVTYEWSQVWSDAYASDGSKCGFQRSEANGLVTLTLDTGLYVWEDLTETRGGAVRRNITSKHPITITFPTTVTAQQRGIRVFSPVRALAVLVSQEIIVDIETPRVDMNLRLRTEVQAPFQLHDISETTTPAAKASLTTDMTPASDVGILSSAVCTDNTTFCVADWDFSYQSINDACDFTGTYEVSFKIRCVHGDPNTPDCPIDDATDSLTITLELASSDHCSKVVETVDLTSQLLVYDTPAGQSAAIPANTEDDFLDTQISYFVAPTSAAEVTIATTEFHSVTLTRPNSVASDVVLMSNTEFVAGTTGNGPYDFSHSQGGSAAPGADSYPTFYFTVKTDAAHLNLADDSREVMTMTAEVDVTYNNALKLGAAKSTRMQTQAVRTVSATVSADIGATGPTSQNTGSATSTASNSNALLGMSAGVAFGAGAAVVITLVVLGVVLVNKSRRTPRKSTSNIALTDIAGETSEDV